MTLLVIEQSVAKNLNHEADLFVSHKQIVVRGRKEKGDDLKSCMLLDHQACCHICCCTSNNQAIFQWFVCIW